MKALKLGAVSLGVGALGLLATVWSLRGEDGTNDHATSGTIRTLTEVETNLSQGLAVWHDSDVVVADGSQVRSIQPGGSEWEVLSVNERGTGVSIRDIAIGPDDSLYVSDDSGVVSRYAEGDLVPVLGEPGSTLSLNSPRGLAATPDGSLYVADMLNDRVLRRAVDGSVLVIPGAIDMPNDMASDAGGNAYVAASDGRVYRVSDDGFNVVFDIRDVRSRVDEQDIAVLFIAFTPDDDLIVADELRSTVWRIDRGHAIRVLGDGTAVSSPDGVPADRATIASPWAVAVLPDYRLLVSESGRLRVIQLAR